MSNILKTCTLRQSILIYKNKSLGNVNTSLLISWFPRLGWGHKGVAYLYWNKKRKYIDSSSNLNEQKGFLFDIRIYKILNHFLRKKKST